MAKDGVASGSVSTADLINNERNSIVSQFCRRVQSVIWNRSLIKTKHGSLGIANKDVIFNDYVAILYGCSVPVILHEKRKSRKQIQKEKIEDEKTKKAKKVWECIEIGLRRKQRRRKWERLPETVTEEQRKEKKWGKSDVREWQKKYPRARGKREGWEDCSFSI